MGSGFRCPGLESLKKRKKEKEIEGIENVENIEDKNEDFDLISEDEMDWKVKRGDR